MIRLSGIKTNLSNRKIFIFGAGALGKDILDFMTQNDIRVEAFIDNDKSKAGQNISGTPIVSFDNITLDGEEIFIIASKDKKSIYSQLESRSAKYEVDYNELRYLFPLKVQDDDYCKVVPFNHYESPYPDIRQIHENEEKLFNSNEAIYDVSFNIERQVELIKAMDSLRLPDWDNTEKYRYKCNNNWFGKGSAAGLSYMMQIIKPKRIVEVGSGYSTAVMLDTNDAFLENSVEIISIEPRADRLKSLLRKDDNIRVIEKNVQDIDLDFFKTLDNNDILFIDSSHVGHIGSDINLIFFDILPRLKQNLYIHFHDIYYPFEYPKTWVYEGRAYNEMYYLRAFLMNNHNYSIQFFGDMIQKTHPELLNESTKNVSGGSIWIRKEK